MLLPQRTTAGKLAAVGGLSLLLLALAVSPVSSTSPISARLPADDEEHVSFDGLLRVEGSLLDEAYIRPDLDLSGYQRILLDPVTVAYKRRPTRSAAMRASGSTGNFALTDAQMEELETTFQEAFEDAMSKSDGWKIAAQSASDVLRVHAELIDLVVKVPTSPSPGRRSYFVTEIGEVTVVLEIFDSQTGQILARGVDRRPIGRDRPTQAVEVTARTDVRRLFDGWATLLRVQLDQIKELTSSSGG